MANCYAFRRDGVQVFQVLDTHQTKEFNRAIVSSLRKSEELKEPAITGEVPLLTLGGSAFLGTPSSFYIPVAMEARASVYAAVMNAQIFDASKRLELLVDRICYRFPGQSAEKESWHRDLTPADHGLEGDVITGGWLNLSGENQRFICIPGSQIPRSDVKCNPKGGFKKLSKDEQKSLNRERKEVVVPPGHFIVFDQTLLHMVNPATARTPDVRVFVGFRSTTDTEPLFPENREIVSYRGVPTIPSGQVPRLYGKMHRACWMSKTFWAGPHKVSGVYSWSEQFASPFTKQVQVSDEETKTIVIQGTELNNQLKHIPGRKLDALTVEFLSGGPRRLTNSHAA